MTEFFTAGAIIVTLGTFFLFGLNNILTINEVGLNPTKKGCRLSLGILLITASVVIIYAITNNYHQLK